MSASTLTGHTSVMDIKNRIFDFPGFRDMLHFLVGLEVWEGLQSMGNGCGLQMNGFSTDFELWGSIFMISVISLSFPTV